MNGFITTEKKKEKKTTPKDGGGWQGLYGLIKYLM